MMKFKLLVPLSALALFVASCSNDDFASSSDGTGKLSPEFAVDYSISDSRNATRATEQASVTPEISQFTFQLTRDGGTAQTFSGLEQLLNKDFAVGSYTLEATYGDPDEEGIDKAYYYGSTTFNIYDGETASPSLTATLSNTAVSIEYTEAFKKYFTAYATTVHSSNGATYVEMPNDSESSWAYVKSGDISLNVSFTKQNGVSGEVEAAKITGAVAGTHYHVTIDANGGEVGNEVITISFDAETDTEPITIDVSDEVINAPAPVITASGYSNDQAIDILEGDDAESDVKASIYAAAGLAEVRLSISSPTPALSTVQGDIDLLSATEEQKAVLTTAGIGCKGLWNNPDQLALIDFSGMLKNLRVADGVSTHTFTLLVKDKYNKVSESVTLTVNAPAPILVLSNPEKFGYGQTEATFDLEYNGTDVQNKIKFQATNSFGVYQDCTIKEVTTEGTNKYKVTIIVPESSDDVNVKAVYNNTTSNVLTIEREVMLVASEGDVWATKADVSISPASAAVNVTGVTLNGTSCSETFSTSTGVISFTGLTAGTQYTVSATLSTGQAVETTFTTENATAVPNGDFETLTQTINISSIQQGGSWSNRSNWFDQTTYTSYNVSEPTGWASVNAKTCCTSASNQNTWFVIPSTFNTSSAQSGSNAMTLRNVGWALSGTTPDKSTNWSEAYCTNSATVANRAAGKLFLGSYSFSTSGPTETYTEGVDFTSRPLSLNGYYKYTRDGNDGSETGVVTVTLLNGSTVLGTGTANLSPASDFTLFNVAITYSNTTLKATTLKIMITSSNHAGTMAEETANIKTTNYMSASEQCTRGAELTVDNLTFAY